MNKKAWVYGSLVSSIIAVILLLPLLIWAPLLSNEGYYVIHGDSSEHSNDIFCYFEDNCLYMWPYTDSYKHQVDKIKFTPSNGYLINIKYDGEYQTKEALKFSEPGAQFTFELTKDGKHATGFNLQMQTVYNPLAIYYLVIEEMFFGP